MAKFYNIDPNTCSMEELEQAIIECKNQEELYHGMEQGAKQFINSVYGAMANKFYQCSNVAMAESVTLQGQDLIKYSVRKINDYFRNVWHTDTDKHKQIAEYLKKLFPNFNDTAFLNNCQLQFYLSEKETLQVYGDTDSAYMTVQPLIEHCKVPLEMETEFILALDKFILEDYFSDIFNKYAEDFNCPKNIEALELEKVARTLIMIAKKHYIMDVSWKEPNVHVEPLHSIIYKGIDVVKGSVPAACRDMMIDFIKMVLTELSTGKKPTYDKLVKSLKDLKKKFALQSPNDISKSFKISDYLKYGINENSNSLDEMFATADSSITDGRKLTIPQHVRAAAYYNYMLYHDAKKYRSKYNFLGQGDKIRFYYTTNKNIPVFGFAPNAYPLEFAPEMDIDIQFEKMILSPLNTIIEALGYLAVSPSLTYSTALW